MRALASSRAQRTSHLSVCESAQQTSTRTTEPAVTIHGDLPGPETHGDVLHRASSLGSTMGKPGPVAWCLIRIMYIM